MNSAIRVGLEKNSYDVVVEDALPEAVAPYLCRLFTPGKLVLITDTTVGGLYGDQVVTALRDVGFDVLTATVAPGEHSKSLSTVEQLLWIMSESGVSRGRPILSLGGGVVSDIAGFVASVFMRGGPVVHVPTTLLAQVDSAVGGKTGVNLRQVKNQVGTFHQPALVFAPIQALRTLPVRELRCGVAEGIKTALVKDTQLAGWLEQCNRFQEWDSQALSHLVNRCCEAKAAVVQQDERESGPRMILNFGHTLGHALESVANEGELLHGEAVGIGMAAAAALSNRLGYCGTETVSKVLGLLSTYGLDRDARSFAGRPWSEALAKDKKAEGSTVTVVLLQGIGQPVLKKHSTWELATWFHEWMLN